MKRQGSATALLIVATTTTFASGASAKPVSSAQADPVALTMTTMRILSTVLVDDQRRDGDFPFADGKLHRVQDALDPQSGTPIAKLTRDGWNHPMWYRAGHGVHELISFGADGRADQDYENQNLYSGRYQPILDAPDPRNDLVLVDGRFVRRPFGSRTSECGTINAMNVIYTAAASFAVDNNRYPGNAADFRPVSELTSDLVPTYIEELPLNDGWGRPLLYATQPGNFVLASYGANGVPEVAYYIDLPCNLLMFGPTTIEDGGDVVQACGIFVNWPRGTEP
jgi:hypothetical protein